jgi:CheY-like chemotaxis protein
VRKSRIVLVDDDPNFIDLFKKALLAECADIRLTTYSSGVNFLEAIPLMASSEHPHLILLDLRMPFMDGMQVARAIRGYEGYQATPIIILTVVEESESVYQAYEWGTNAYLIKPFSWQDMNQLAKNLCLYWINLGQLPYRW